MMAMNLLAEVAQADPMISGAYVLKVIGAIFSGLALLLGGKHWGSRARTTTRIEDQPLKVEFAKEFITREEHNTHRAEVRADMQRLEANYQRMTERVDGKHLELLATIERAAKTGVDGRVALWDELKPMGKELAALKATSNVAEQLGKLADTLKQNQQRNGKTTGN